MKKKKIHKIPDKKRKWAVVVSVVSAAVLVSALTVFGIVGVPVDRNVIKATCNTVSEIKYDLIFRDDPLYNETDLEFGDGYVSKYVNAMDLDFLYDFNCSEATDINGTYSVTALLKATYNNSNLIWEKEYPLVHEKAFAVGQFSDGYYLPLSEYKEKADAIDMATGVSTSDMMTVTFKVNVSALVDGTPVSDTSVSTLTFNLSENVMVVGGTPRAEQSSNVEETVTQELVPRKAALFITIPLAILSLCSVAFLLAYTKGVPEDPVRRQLRKLYKSYGNRIVELYPGTAICSHSTITVSSFRDLLLTADELKRPIFKKSSADYEGVEFCVIDESEVYVFKPGTAYEAQHRAAPDGPEDEHFSVDRNI